jgi:LPXTG-site transpeptidase (sortase) family protein
MGEDTEGNGSVTIPQVLRWVRDWLRRPGTIRVVAPAAFLVGIALVVGGVILLSAGGGGSGVIGVTDEGPGGITTQPGTAFRVPPRLADGVRYRVPERQPLADFRLVIDSLGVNAPVVRLGLDSRDVPQVPNDAAKVAWYEFSANPGTGSNAVLAGHVRWAGDRGVFADLDELDDGDLIRVKWKSGQQAVYQVFANRVLNARDPDAVHVMSPTAEDTITLITCGGTFVVDSDNPLGGDFTHRSVIQARLVQPSVASLSR